ncbi:MAG: hypothetical protein IPM06_22485 [Rhizobiales bacterium]|jgi:hypothetical protein|nr:hypothetical protein [Hyphomicrobiales bacterium]
MMTSAQNARPRLIAIDQVVVAPLEERHEMLLPLIARPLGHWAAHAPTRAMRLKVCAVPDAAGGDVFCPATPCEAFIAEALRRAGWPHPIWAEVVT